MVLRAGAMADVDLLECQRRLDQHFTGLHARRAAEAPGQPIFGLEHGLDDHEVSALVQAIREHIATSPPNLDHRLAWVVYASEFGYIYAGDEYWQTFEVETPGWELHGDRHWIRLCFRSFHERYGGAKPTGVWARHFSIICWPITHAILPCDLQRQLARLLYEIRYSLSAEVLASPQRLGELVAARSWDTSSRFQQLTQEPLFVGQIAAALLLHGDEVASSLIHPPTLARISVDLDSERRARTWLRGARENAQRRLQFQRIRGQAVRRDPRERGAGEVVRGDDSMALEPRLILRPLSERGWEVRLELPDLSHLPIRFPSLGDALLRCRCRVPASSERPRARGYLLHGPQTVTLQRWPRHDEPLVHFEKSPPELDYLLRTECLLRPGPVWLFKVAADGLAYELRTSNVRPGHKYLMLFEQDRSVPTHPCFAPVNVPCDGIQAVEINLPPTITADLSCVLNEVGLRQAGTIHVWPSGLTPARWDGEGVAEWLSTDVPVVGIRADHDVDGFALRLGFQTLDVVPSQPGKPVFVELPRLDPGAHTLYITAIDRTSETAETSGALEVRIREPRVWAPGTSCEGGFLVVVEPNGPTLEQLWEGEVELAVHGPESRRVRCAIELYKRGEGAPCLRTQLPPLRLPVSNSVWQKHFEQHFKKSRDVQNHYDLAHSCQLHLRADDLGRFTLTSEREFSPLRWAVRRTRSEFFLRVLDDSGSDVRAQVSLYSFDSPDRERSLDSTPFLRLGGERAGTGLYVVQTADHLRSVVIPPEVRTFTDFRIQPGLSVRRRTPADVLALLRVLELWARARLTGSVFSLFMRRDVHLALLREVFRLIAGDHWTEVERAAREGSGDGDVLRAAERVLTRKRDELAFLAKLAAEAKDLAGMTPLERTECLCSLVIRHLHVAPPPAGTGMDREDRHSRVQWLCEFALRLASGAKNIGGWAGKELPGAISSLLESPSLARAARFLVFAIARERNAGLGWDLYAGWGWE